MSLVQTLSQTNDRYKLLSTKEMQAVVKIEAGLVKGARKYLSKENFTEVIVPHITKATGSCEDMDSLYSLEHFGEQAYLAQTGQLYLESLVPSLGKVFCVGPSFRAERDVDGRHLCEFTLLEIELPGNLSEVMYYIENMLYGMIQEILKNNREDLDFVGANPERLEKVKAPFKKIKYSDAVEPLGLKFGDDLKSNHEKQLVEMHGNLPLFVTHYPTEIKFFNMKTNRSDPRIVDSTDLVLPYSGEAFGCAEREYEIEPITQKLKNSVMLKQLENRGGSIKDFSWYLNHIKEANNVPHGGGGMGLNRVTQFALGMDDIRACTCFPLNRESLM